MLYRVPFFSLILVALQESTSWQLFFPTIESIVLALHMHFLLAKRILIHHACFAGDVTIFVHIDSGLFAAIALRVLLKVGTVVHASTRLAIVLLHLHQVCELVRPVESRRCCFIIESYVALLCHSSESASSPK